jgi:NADPH:quinone reductase-like Zn-dependent oxidoreductase
VVYVVHSKSARIIERQIDVPVESSFVPLGILPFKDSQARPWMPIMLRRLTVSGSTLRPRNVEEKAAIAEGLHVRVWPMLESGQVKVVIYRTFPFSEVVEAHRLMESGEHTGKIVLDLR